MSTFLYAPGVKVYINTEPKSGENETIDVSEDLISGELVRRSDGVSTFQFSLQNTRRKYDRYFKPNDRIIVMMKRLTWVRVFTGYLNTVPLITAWPKVVNLSASCSLKRLQYWYWDPNAAKSLNKIQTALTEGQDTSDSGMTNLTLTLLKDVVGWPEEKVHIGAIPKDWFKFALMIAEDVGARSEEADAIAEQYYSILGGGGSVGGAGGALGGQVDPSALPPGEYGGVHLNQAQTRIAVIVYNAGIAAGCNKKAIIALLATCYTECTFNENVGGGSGVAGDRSDTVGIFQQGPEVGGTYEQRRNPKWAAKKAAQEMKGIQDTNRNPRATHRRLGKSPLTGAGTFENAPIKDIAWVLQAYDYTGAVVPGIPARYTKHAKIATAIVNKITSNNIPGSAGSSPSNPSQNIDEARGNQARNSLNQRSGGNSGLPTGMDIAKKGMETANYYIRNRGGPLKYSQSLDRSRNMKWGIDRVKSHDCSSFVRWVCWNVMGKDIGSYTGAQCHHAGKGRRVDLNQALKTRGALLFRGAHTHQHVAISLGDGNRTVETGSDTPSGRLQIKEGRWGNSGNEFGVLLDGVDYTADGGGIGMGDYNGTGEEATEAGGIPVLKYQDQEWYQENDDFDRIFGNTNWVPQTNESAMAQSLAFAGIRALMNDEPFLPYIKNMMNSTLRSFCSAPNGDFMAWFPDYYGIWGTAGSMRVEPIELQDFEVNWSDDFFVTHQYTQAAWVNKFDVATGAGMQPSDSLLPAVTTIGIASIDVPSMLYSILGVEVDKEAARKFSKWVYQRFGARPDFQTMPGMRDKQGEFFSAVHLFMRQWAYQYSADVPITFMPELWPGMLMKIPKFDFQAYVVTVTHAFQFGPTGHFSTSVNIAAPARMPQSADDRTHALMGLPMAGGLQYGGQTTPEDPLGDDANND